MCVFTLSVMSDPLHKDDQRSDSKVFYQNVPCALSVALVHQLQCPLRATKNQTPAYTLEFFKIDSEFASFSLV